MTILQKEKVVISMRHNETHVQVYGDPDTQVLHILDLDSPGTYSLTNAVNSQPSLFFLTLSAKLQQPTQHYEETWLYGTDGVICKYAIDTGFTAVPLDDERIPEEFLQVMKERL